MRLRSRKFRSPLLLLLLPSLAQALSIDRKPGSVEHLKAGEKDSSASANAAAIAISGPPGKGTKDAPVDGLDGKPHAGPFVESTKKKQPQQVEEISSSRGSASKEKVLSATFDHPEDDGVMSDVRNHKEVTGPTGTEGGVSQKDRERQGKGPEEKRPSQPKEAPPRPDSDGRTKSFNTEKKESTDEKEKKKGAAGLEVSLSLVCCFVHIFQY
jgi:hypothetical protein